MNFHRRLTVLFLIGVVALPGALFAQTGEAPAYKPYVESEFPLWLRALRRAEVVFIGSFPITILMSSLSYEGYRATRNLIGATPSEDRAEFGSFNADERMWLVVSGACLAGVVAFIDFLIDLKENRSAEGSAK